MKKIAVERLDPGFKDEVAGKPGGENIRKCFACGTCTAGCPVFQVEGAYNPRKIIRMILLGMRAEVLSSKEIWLCARCYTCTANCPQDVDFSNVMMALRDMAVREGLAPADLPERIERIGSAAHEMRRDAINLLLGLSGADEAKVRGGAEKVLSETAPRALRAGSASEASAGRK